MRVNPNYTPDFLATISQTQERQQTALQQLASGKRVAAPSDDPAAAAMLVQNHASADMTNVYRQSITSLKGQLQTADSALATVITSMNRAISLGTQGGNSGFISDANRQQIANDVDGVLNSVLQVANTQYQGVFLFAGTKNGQQPFSTTTGAYSGNDAVNQVAVGEGRTVTVNVSGQDLFVDTNVISSLQNLRDKLRSGAPVSDVQAATAQVNTAMNAFSTARVPYGNTVKQLEAADSYLETEQVNLASEENDLIGVDVTKAVTDLSTAVLANSAALSAYSKVAQTTLLDYIK